MKEERSSLRLPVSEQLLSQSFLEFPVSSIAEGPGSLSEDLG